MNGEAKVALVSSVGGHLSELLALRHAFEDLNHFFVLNDEAAYVAPQGARVYRIEHGERDWRVAANVVECCRIFLRERPTVVLSTGASPAVCAAVAAKLVGAKTVFVESVASVRRLSLTGMLMAGLADEFFVQWSGLAREPGVRFAGSVLK